MLSESAVVRKKYGKNDFILENKNGLIAWSCDYKPRLGRCDFYLSCFIPGADGRYTRRDEEQSEYCYSDKKLRDIDPGLIASIIKTSDLTRLADQLDDSMGTIFNMFVWFGVLTYLIIIYLLSKQILDRNARNIGMVKILGYDSREIGLLYNRVTGVITIAAFLICIPIGDRIFQAIFRTFMMDYHGWFTYYIAPSVYVKLIVIALVGYFIVSLLQQRRIRRIPAANVVKIKKKKMNKHMPDFH